MERIWFVSYPDTQLEYLKSSCDQFSSFIKNDSSRFDWCVCDAVRQVVARCHYIEPILLKNIFKTKMLMLIADRMKKAMVSVYLYTITKRPSVSTYSSTQQVSSKQGVSKLIILLLLENIAIALPTRHNREPFNFRKWKIKSQET